MTLDEKIALLKQFVAKAGCMHSQHRADELWWKLKPELSEYEWSQLSIARGHHVDVGLGRGELDGVLAEILCGWGQPHSVLYRYRCQDPKHYMISPKRRVHYVDIGKLP
jgi:hypothetical protein